MARKRPEASNVVPPSLICLEGGLSDTPSPLLTRAETQALRRSATLTRAQLGTRPKPAPKVPLREV